MKRLILPLLLILSLPALAQEKPWRFTYNGYLNNLQGAFFDTLKNNLYSYNLVHNRFDFDLYYKNTLQLHLSVRNRLYWGDFINLVGSNTLAGAMEQRTGFFDLSHNLDAKKTYILNSQIDRLFVKYTAGNFELTLGRQRINWAQTFVWNPVNIFNTYSVFEPDYPERPGSDAIDAVYYWGTSSSVEAAASLDSDTNLTAALRFATTVSSFDISIISGYYKSSKYVTAAGWTGYIGSVTWRGEINALWKKDGLSLDNIIVSTGFDYTFPKNVTLLTEFAYNDAGKNNLGKLLTTSPDLLSALYFAPDDINFITLQKYNLFAQLMFTPTPLITVNLGGIVTFENYGYLLLPSVSFSLSQNTDLSLSGQAGHFELEIPDPYGILPPTEIKTNSYVIFLKLSYNFGK